MYTKWEIALSVLIISFIISACGTPATAPDSSALTSPTVAPEILTDQPPDSIGEFNYGEAAQWPAYIPADIPVLQGKIRLVTDTQGSSVRIFYEELPKSQLEKYLQLLEQQGFRLEYIVYVQEGFPDNSEEHLKKGDYDAVDITIGDYHMRLEYGAGSATYDIYTIGFAEAIPTHAWLDWPADLVYVVPKPDRDGVS